MQLCSIRGATTIEKNTKEDIVKNTENLLKEIISQNDIETKDIISIIFTCTKDITKAYPAISARNLGIVSAGLICLQEMEVEASLDMCIRVMVTAHTKKTQEQIEHIYLNRAKILRPDIAFNKNGFAVAIDGPAGSGKSTIAKKIAKELSFVYVDTGAMYRSVAFYFIKHSINFNNIEEVNKHIDDIDIKLEFVSNAQNIFLNDVNITEKIRTQEIGEAASVVAKVPKVREKLIFLQRNLAKNKSIVMDGRDIGTNVLPNAEVKIYMDADVEERALRRLNELKEKNQNYDFDEIKSEILKRDFEDKNRAIAPLKKAADAIAINTTKISIDQVKSEIIKIIKEKIK